MKGIVLAAAHFVETIETRQGYKIPCLEEIAYYQGWLSDVRLKEIGQSLAKTGYGEYLLNLVKN